MITLGLIDDHHLVRVALHQLLHQNPALWVVMQAATSADALQALAGCGPVDVLLTDVNLPDRDGVFLTRQVRAQYPNTRVLALSSYDDEACIMAMTKAGAHGYLLKTEVPQTVYDAIACVARGESYYSPSVSGRLVNHVLRPQDTPRRKAEQPLTPISQRELEVLRLLAQEFSNEEIGEKLFISVRTVENHRRNLLQKTGARNSIGLVRFAFERGYV